MAPEQCLEWKTEGPSIEIEVIVFNVGCQIRISIIKTTLIRICLSMSGWEPDKFCGRWLFRNTGFPIGKS